MWEIELTDDMVAFYEGLPVQQRDAVTVRIDLLEQQGPALRRPTVGEIKGSENDPQMKELICETKGAHIRVLFMFDPRRSESIWKHYEVRGKSNGKPLAGRQEQGR